MIIRIKDKPIFVILIIKLNLMVFFLWMISAFTYPEFMMKHFLVSWSGLLEGRVWTLVTSVFSHNLFFHIFINMYAFFGFGAVLETTLGHRRFLMFYLSAGMLASLMHCLVSQFILHEPTLPALGASGAVAGVVLLFSLLYPKEKILILGLIPVPAIMAAGLIVGIDLWGLFEQSKGGTLPIGHGAHLGGAFYGVIYFFFLRAKRSKDLLV
jgi:rhomboid-like protein